MRVPIPLVVFLSLAVVVGVWWYGSRNADFLTPPSAAKLAEIRASVESSLPPADHPAETVPAPPEITEPAPPPPAEEVKPSIDLGDLNAPPSLQEYSDHAPKGAAHLIELAVLLEAEGEFQRALLAWERVLDAGKPEEGQAAAAITAIKRLRPTLPDWNTEPAKAIAITLHAGAGKKTARIITPVLEETARDLEHASAGILKITAKVTAGRDQKRAADPAPVALWLTGPNKESRSTEVLSFTVASPETLREQIHKTVFSILRGYLGHATTAQTPPPALGDGTPALDALNSHITRRHWQELGTALNHPPEKTE